MATPFHGVEPMAQKPVPADILAAVRTKLGELVALLEPTVTGASVRDIRFWYEGPEQIATYQIARKRDLTLAEFAAKVAQRETFFLDEVDDTP